MKELISGVYIIRNKFNSKVYIGSSKNIERRFYIHKLRLTNNNHSSKEMKKDWNTYGENSFYIEILETVDDVSLLKMREQYYLDKFESYINGYSKRKH